MSNYFNTDTVLALVLADGSDLEEEESVEKDFGDLEGESDLENCAVRSQDKSFSEGPVQPLLPSDRSSLLAEEVRAKYLVFISSHFLDQSLKFIAQTLSKLKLLLLSSIQSCLRICYLEFIFTFYCKTSTWHFPGKKGQGQVLFSG